jgi:hypothetical protein
LLAMRPNVTGGVIAHLHFNLDGPCSFLAIMTSPQLLLACAPND